MRSTARLTIQWVFFFCFLSRCSADTSPASSAQSESRAVRSRRSRWERHDAPVTSNPSKNGASSQPGPPTSISAMAAGRKACGLYVWDAPSALLHKWCTHLMKDCIYEGRGGHKFARIEPGTILQLLYPCSRHSPDRCLLCGGNFQDHLALRWSKHLYSPYDNILGKTLAKGVVSYPEQEEMSAKSSNRRNQKAPPVRFDPPRPRYVYHRRYVTETDMEPTVGGKNSKRGSSGESLLERRVVTECNVAYTVPTIFDKIKDKRPSETLGFVREILLQAVDNLVRLEEKENAVGEATHN